MLNDIYEAFYQTIKFAAAIYNALWNKEEQMTFKTVAVKRDGLSV